MPAQQSKPNAQLLQDWQQLLAQLFSDLKTWAEDQNWLVSPSEKTLDEPKLGPYVAPVLQIRTPRGAVTVDTVGREILKADGRVDIEAWPSLNRIKLLRQGSAWEIMTESGVPIRRPWGKETFVELVEDLLA